MKKAIQSLLPESFLAKRGRVWEFSSNEYHLITICGKAAANALHPLVIEQVVRYCEINTLQTVDLGSIDYGSKETAL